MHADGWAVIVNNEILVSTVSPTRRGAIVNWLWTYMHWRLTNQDTDAQIEEIWCKEKTTNGMFVTVQQVYISALGA